MTALRRAAIVTVAAALALPACGSSDGGDEVRAAGPTGTWQRQLLPGDPGPDYETQVAVDGNEVVVVAATDAGELLAYRAGADGRFTVAETLAADVGYPGIGAVGRVGERWIALGGSGSVDSGGPRFTVQGFASSDGLTWRELAVTGFDGPAETTAMIAVDGRAIAVGTLRTAADPGSGGFLPVAWHSEDAQRWTQVPLPTAGAAEGSVADVVRVGDLVLATGRLGDRGALWSSTDGGRSWSIGGATGVPASTTVGSVVTAGDVAVMSAQVPVPSGDEEELDYGASLILRSTDDGQTWREATSPPPTSSMGYPLPLFAAAGRFFALGYSYNDPWRSPEVCYADIALCRQGRTTAAFVSDDGDQWDRLDVTGIGGEPSVITATADGRVIALRRAEGGLEAWTWPAGEPLPLAGPTEPLPEADVDLLEEGEQPEVGRRYAVPLYVHCGMGWLYLGGEPWQRTDDGPDVETGAGDAAPEGWPIAGQTIFGFATLTSDDVIEYAIDDGEVIATYERSSEAPPGCA
jgi:hypothetical protein